MTEDPRGPIYLSQGTHFNHRVPMLTPGDLFLKFVNPMGPTLTPREPILALGDSILIPGNPFFLIFGSRGTNFDPRGPKQLNI